MSDFAKNIKNDTNVIDLGTGTGILGFLLIAKTKVNKVTGIEIQSEIADMANRSIKLNKLEDKFEILNCNINELDKIVKKGKIAKIHLKNTDDSIHTVESYLTGGEVLGFGLEKELGQDIITNENVDTIAFVSRRS